MKLPVGTKVKFENEKKRYTVQASDENYAVCTYPLNIIKRLPRWERTKKGKAYEHEKTVMYTIIDFKQNIRGTENLIFGMGAETREDCEAMLARLTEKDDPSEVSGRNYRRLDIEALTYPYQPVRIDKAVA